MSRAAALPPARILVFLAGLLAAIGLLISLGTSTASAAKPCWERVVDDWIDNGNIDATYPPACLQAALKNVPEDVRAYSDFEERVKQARQNAFRDRFLQGTGGGGTGTAPSTSGTARPRVDKIQEVEPDVASAAEAEADSAGPIPKALRTGTTDASSIPLPLIVLAGLALLLMAAGAAGFAQRKLAARKIRS
jgi:L-aminopeptidase/D-esterase-like protein